MNAATAQLVEKGQMLPLMEAFYTIQGEGITRENRLISYALEAAMLVAIGAMLKSWNAELHPPTHIQDMIDDIMAQSSETVVVTGGEPLMWNMQPLTDLLHQHGLKVHIETSGAYPLSGFFDWICLSPKKTMPPIKEVLVHANELKVIIHNQH